MKSKYPREVRRRPKIKYYKTLDWALAAFFKCKPSEVKNMSGIWRWSDADGTEHALPMQECIEYIRTHRKTWGFIEMKKNISLWISNDASPEDIIRVIAHEMGHAEEPYHDNSSDEEQKACKYAEVAKQAYLEMRRIGYGSN